MQRRSFVGLIVVASGLLLATGDPRLATREPAGPPPSLTDRDFWRLSVDASEPNGYFRSENLASNELQFQYVIPDLARRTQPGRVYLGVGPEQNFTYIAVARPALAVIFDIRRANLLLQLMYKALFEIAGSRAEFVSLLFSRPLLPGVGPDSTAAELMSAVSEIPAPRAVFLRNLQAIDDQLTDIHHLPLTREDLDGIEHVYEAFYENGYKVRYSPSYDELMTATDGYGVPRSYLAREASFAFVKDLQSRNLVVPVVGDFAGPKAIRQIGAYLKARSKTVSVFYLSNVEQYLDGKTVDFCRNVRSLPLDASSTFIRSSSRGVGGLGYGYRRGVGFVSSLGKMAEEARYCE